MIIYAAINHNLEKYVIIDYLITKTKESPTTPLRNESDTHSPLIKM